ncbi:MAG: hypothetical protein AAGB51_13615 [Planctomycetota bacterium]
MLFTGQADLNIDAKGRLAIPAKHRSKVDPGVHGTEWICVPWPTGVLRLYPEKTFAEIASRADATLTPGPEEAELEAALFGMAEAVEPDSANRIMLPKRHLGLLDLDGEVTVLGVRHHLEVWRRDAWQKDEESRFARLPELVARAARQRDQ